MSTVQSPLLLLLLLAPALTAVGGAGAALANDGATGVVKERIDSMEAFAKAGKALARQLRRAAPEDIDMKHLARHAQTIYQHSQGLAMLFPEGSLRPPSEALPAIWQQWERFSDMSRRFEEDSRELARLADSGDLAGVRAGFETVTQHCKRCHRDFRQPKD